MIKHLLAVMLMGATAGVAPIAAAQEWPSRPITIILPTSPGGTGDTMARVLAEGLRTRLGQPIIVENKPGASGILGLQQAVAAPPDGYTFVIGWPQSIVASEFLYKQLPFNAVQDLAPVSRLTINQMVLAVPASVPATNPKEFIAWAKENKGKRSYGSYGLGGFGHLISEHINQEYKLDYVHVPYKGEQPTLMAVAGGEVDFGVVGLFTALKMQEAGRLRIVGTFDPERPKQLPDLPTFKEAGFDDPALINTGWYALFAPKKTPQHIIDRMEKEVRAVLNEPAVSERLSGLGLPLVGSTAQEMKADWDKEIPVYKMLIEKAKVSYD